MLQNECLQNFNIKLNQIIRYLHDFERFNYAIRLKINEKLPLPFSYLQLEVLLQPFPSIIFLL